jgi:hypothetical protein
MFSEYTVRVNEGGVIHLIAATREPGGENPVSDIASRHGAEGKRGKGEKGKRGTGEQRMGR